ncbi:hypothetical protein F441_13643 [Phytophthora nicotianae CJ01A1]|uniref:Uncharacterized protein n=5 Tax=Phytophthora nicotianae TaxID=4792 RepID=W2R5P5_PHYN3|nr:hypothetical protein PPTG_03654 [Phytophthora nicotianae INRA-310]ETI41004.1 hypothetical protein F443_13714 [Phytophthora nicotianae P1569]ETK81097.1 hypothetical protein L915_13373 [Phytophthora nicotianae]ETP10778.1 hypothetical protein F441_13643 [Phytophthora nicotianae CJ01A1]ETP38928.1 hypothetical protein F442_13565 [Phytophthora nicotianae P10297]ETL34528.1 hypothetical protein L916_13253 [Phytophthora nicotianae]
MAAKKDKTPAVYDSDSDEAPEVVTKQSATEQALTQQRQEEEARAQATAAKSRKRKTKQEPKPEEEVPELSDDVLSAVAARNEEEEEEDKAEELRAKKRRAVEEAKLAKLMEKKTHTRQFGNIQVQTLESLENTQTRELSTSAKQFLERRLAPTRARMNIMEGHPSQFARKQKLRSQRT